MTASAQDSWQLDVEAVTALVEHVARTVVAPRFRDLVAGEVSEKSPGDLVTVVDMEAEAVLTAGLREIAPHIPVVGEEAASADPRVLERLDQHLAWVVDPVDGTRAFVEGEPDYAVMVGLVRDGVSVAGWICLPEHDETYVAERGAGAFRNGERLGGPAAGGDGTTDVRGAVAVSYLPVDLRERFEGVLPALGPQMVTGDRLWSGKAYADLASGRRDAVVYWRTSPWDHAPGAVILREMGGRSRRFDGSEYRPGVPGESLVIARDLRTDQRVREVLGLTA